MSLSNISAAHLFGNDFDKSMQKEKLKKIKSHDDSSIFKDTYHKISSSNTEEESIPASCS